MLATNFVHTNASPNDLTHFYVEGLAKAGNWKNTKSPTAGDANEQQLLYLMRNHVGSGHIDSSPQAFAWFL